jgi:protease I
MVTKKESIMELRGKRVAILVEDDYKALEVWYPLLRFREAEAAVTVVGLTARSYVSTDGIPIQADAGVEQVRADDFEAIVIPGGSAAETISQHPAMLALISEAIRQHKVIAMIVQSRQEKMLNDEGSSEIGAVIQESNLIKAQPPVDLPAFCRMIIAALSSPSPPD